MEKMNFRQVARLNPNYWEINREERNYAAIFFAALCKPGNAKRFLSYLGLKDEIGPDFGIYFEYAFLRDLWNKIEDNGTKKELIRNHLKLVAINDILDKPTVEINRVFGVTGDPSHEYVQFPGKWAISKYANHFPDNDEFLRVCRFKWSFNIKPDIVIHLNKDRAICIEAKFESSEGAYPTSAPDMSVFRARKLQQVKQMELQEYMMEELLGIQTDYVFLVFNKEQRSTHKVVSWAEVFSCLGLSDLPHFASEMARRISRREEKGQPLADREA
jgi:hypothetical protein